MKMAAAPINSEQVPTSEHQINDDNNDEEGSFSSTISTTSSQPIVPAIRTGGTAREQLRARPRSYGHRLLQHITAWTARHLARLQATILSPLIGVQGAEAFTVSNAEYGGTSTGQVKGRIRGWSERVGYETWGDGYDEFSEPLGSDEGEDEGRDLGQAPGEVEPSWPGSEWDGGWYWEFWYEDDVNSTSQKGRGAATLAVEREPFEPRRQEDYWEAPRSIGQIDGAGDERDADGEGRAESSENEKASRGVGGAVDGRPVKR